MTASNTASGDASVSSGQQLEAALQPPQPKKKRNLPGMPDPEAEVIALSPKALLATNRFVCEICNKGFQRDQNLQLHRRGHNLPWKLRLRTGKDVKKRVYVCPEPSCVHHHPSRALGDLTGIKKHFCRKHGEKKWKCDKCSKKYAVQSDWKAHSKTCGSREYRCDCGTLFSRRDSFITHRAFCDALAEESARTQTEAVTPAALSPPAEKEQKTAAHSALPHQHNAPPPPPNQQVAKPEISAGLPRCLPPPAPVSISVNSSNSSGTTTSGSSSSSGTTTSVFARLFASSGSVAATQRTSFSDLIGAVSRTDTGACGPSSVETPLLCLSSNGPAPLFPPARDLSQFTAPPPSAHMSATALLQKAAQMGAAASGSSFLRGLGFATSSPHSGTGGGHQGCILEGVGVRWCPEQQQPPQASAGLGLGLTYDSGGGATGLPDMVMGSASLFESKPATLDLLGLGMDSAVSANSGELSALITSIGGGGVGLCPAGFGGSGRPPSGKAWEAGNR